MVEQHHQQQQLLQQQPQLHRQQHHLQQKQQQCTTSNKNINHNSNNRNYIDNNKNNGNNNSSNDTSSNNSAICYWNKQGNDLRDQFINFFSPKINRFKKNLTRFEFLFESSSWSEIVLFENKRKKRFAELILKKTKTKFSKKTN